MQRAITLCLDARAAAEVEALWQMLAAAGVSDEAFRLGYRPHITLMICPWDVPEDTMRAGLQSAALHPAITFELASFGLFPGPPPVLFLAPVVTSELLDLHATTTGMLPTALVHPHYRPGAWVPHVTLATDVTEPWEALQAVSAVQLPIAGTLERAELVEFRPVRVIAGWPLGQASE